MDDNLKDAVRVLARIALIEACANSEPDVMGIELDNAIASAQKFFHDHPHIRMQDVL